MSKFSNKTINTLWLIVVLCLIVMGSGAVIIQYKKTVSIEDSLNKHITELNNSIKNLEQERVRLEGEIDRFNNIAIADDSVIEVREKPNKKSKVVGLYYKGYMISTQPLVDDVDWVKTPDGYILKESIIYVDDELGRTKLQSVDKINKMTKTGSRGDYLITPQNNFKISTMGKSNLTVPIINKLLENTPMKGTGKAIIDVEVKYNVNAFFTLAVAKQESGFGGKPGEIAYEKRNAYSLNAVDKSPRKSAYTYGSYSENIHAFGELISRKYFGEGRKDLTSINDLYCSSKDWAGQVNNHMNKLLREAKNISLLYQ